MVLYQVFYEEDEMWFSAGFAFASDGFRAIDCVKTRCLDQICRRTERNKEEVLNDLNFDFQEVITVDGKKINKTNSLEILAGKD